MDSSKLKLNPNKTEFIVLSSKVLLNQLAHLFPVNILGNLFSPCDIKLEINVGEIFFYSLFGFFAQDSSIFSSTYNHSLNLQEPDATLFNLQQLHLKMH